MSREAEITQFSFEEEADEHKTNGVLQGGMRRKEGDRVCYGFPAQTVPWTDGL